jgi:hypothetical protein
LKIERYGAIPVLCCDFLTDRNYQEIPKEALSPLKTVSELPDNKRGF